MELNIAVDFYPSNRFHLQLVSLVCHFLYFFNLSRDMPALSLCIGLVQSRDVQFSLRQHVGCREIDSDKCYWYGLVDPVKEK
jgi:hypothetical protein